MRGNNDSSIRGESLATMCVGVGQGVSLAMKQV